MMLAYQLLDRGEDEDLFRPLPKPHDRPPWDLPRAELEKYLKWSKKPFFGARLEKYKKGKP